MNFYRSIRNRLLEALAILVLPSMAMAGPVFTNGVIRAESGDNAFILQLKTAAALGRLLSEGITVSGIDMSGVTINTATNVDARIINTIGLTDTQLRATPVPVLATIATAYNPDVNVTNSTGLTDTQLRATAVPISTASIVSTNYARSITGANVVTNCAWSITNALARVNGGSGLIQALTLIQATNRDYTIWVFNKIISAPTAGNAWTPTLADLQFVAAKFATTNAAFSDWNMAGTNYVKTCGNLAIPFKNSDASMNVHIIATALDTKANQGTNTIVTIGAIQD